MTSVTNLKNPMEEWGWAERVLGMYQESRSMCSAKSAIICMHLTGIISGCHAIVMTPRSIVYTLSCLFAENWAATLLLLANVSMLILLTAADRALYQWIALRSWHDGHLCSSRGQRFVVVSLMFLSKRLQAARVKLWMTAQFFLESSSCCLLKVVYNYSFF